ncbi:MAG TPA: GNAT family N-acetyltransferase [Terracidiphilus sp.]|jgi:predicted N-acetyltransferase YhbS|nr:GNAT family N-acetyltransferase [Terracidiphilus sp.]
MTGETIPDLHIRQATAVDRPRLVQLINSAFSIETFLEGTRTDEERLATMMKKGNLLVAEDATGHPLGSVYTELRGARGFLGMLAVDPAHQRGGVGRRLMEAAEDQFRRLCCNAVDITVLSLRPELPPLYRRFGYVETGEEEFHPSHPQKPGFACNCIVMSKQL